MESPVTKRLRQNASGSYSTGYRLLAKARNSSLSSPLGGITRHNNGTSCSGRVKSQYFGKRLSVIG